MFGRSRFLLLVITALALGSLTLPASHGAAAPPGGPSEQQSEDEPITSDEPDPRAWASYAERWGVSTEEAQRRLEIEGQVTGLGYQMQQLLGDRFAGAFFVHQPDFGYVVRLVGNDPVPDQAMALADRALVNVEFEFGANLSRAELSAKHIEVSDAASEIFELAGSYPDVVAAAIVLHIQPSSPNLDRIEEIERELEEEFGVAVNLQVLPERAGDDHLKYGGMGLGSGTSAFAVQNYSGAKGLLTNAHLLSNTPYVYLPTGHQHSGVGLGSAYGPSHDVQWVGLTGDGQPEPKFYDGLFLRSVAGGVTRLSQELWTQVCHYGKTTGYSCGTLTTNEYKPFYQNACGPGQVCAETWMFVAGAQCSGGDSGGPWFKQSPSNVWKAYGVHKGSPEGGCIYMAINYITAMSVFLLTN